MTSSADALEIGPRDLLLRKYRVQGIIGKGGTSLVFAARHEQLGTTVAIKVLSVSPDLEEDAARRFLREARAAAALRSPHVARILDVEVDDFGRHCLVMERLEGRDLSRVVREEGPLSIQTAVGFVSHVCAGMEEAHAAGILHRDLKPENLFLTTGPDGQPLVKIVDFGVSKVLDSRLPVTASSTTGAGMLIGTPLYMSPERLKSPAEAEPRADVWAVGAILYELLTGKRPFAAATLPELIAALLSDDAPAPLTAVRPDAPGELGKVIAACLEKDVSQRMPCMASLRAALRPWTPAWAHGSAPRPAAVADLRPRPEPEDTAASAVHRWKVFSVGVVVVAAALGLVARIQSAGRVSPVGPTVVLVRPAAASAAPGSVAAPPPANVGQVPSLSEPGVPTPTPPVTSPALPPAAAVCQRRSGAQKTVAHGESPRRKRAADPLEGRQ